MRGLPLASFLLIPLFLACNRQVATAEKHMQEALAYHQQAAEIQRSVMVALPQLEQERNQINIQGRALTETELQKVAAIEAILADYATFQQEFRPVDKKEVSPKLVDQQKAYLAKIKRIREAIEQLGSSN